MTTTDRIRDLIQIGEDLCAFLARENAALARHDRDFVARHVDDKTRLSIAYDKMFKAVTGDEETLAEARTEHREQLLEMNERMQELMLENVQRVEAAAASGRIVLDVIADAVRKAEPDAKTYSGGGKVEDKGRRNARGTSVAIDETL